MITRRKQRRKFGEMEDTENAGDVHNVQTPVANLSQKASPQRQQDVQQGTPVVADQPHSSHGTPPTVCLGHPHNKPAAESLFLRLRPQLHTGEPDTSLAVQPVLFTQGHLGATGTAASTLAATMVSQELDKHGDNIKAPLCPATDAPMGACVHGQHRISHFWHKLLPVYS